MSLSKLHLQNATNASCPDLRGQGYSASFHTHSSARGPRKKIYHGHLDGEGPRKGEHAVVKVFRDKPGSEALCDEEIEKHKLARKLCGRFNKLVADERSQIHFTLPLKSTVDSVGLGTLLARHSIRAIDKKEWVLMEENLLHKGPYQVFIRKSGERLSQEPTSLDAFMHFTYQESEGLFLMCGFQGVHTSSGYTLTTPCLHSTDHSFGYTVDKGQRGIKMAFKHHHCNNICYSFLRPDPTVMASVSSGSESETKDDEEEVKAVCSHVLDPNGEGDHKGLHHVADDLDMSRSECPQQPANFYRTRKMLDTHVVAIPQEGLDRLQLPSAADSEPSSSSSMDVDFRKGKSCSPEPVQRAGTEEEGEKKKKTKKKKSGHKCHLKVLTNVLKKRPSL